MNILKDLKGTDRMTQKNRGWQNISLWGLCGQKFLSHIRPIKFLGAMLPGHGHPTLKGRVCEQGPAVTDHSVKEISPVVLSH